MRKLFLPLAALALCLVMMSPAWAQRQAQTPQTLVVSVDRANIRDKATTTGSAVVATLDKGEQLEVLETAGTWYRVRVTSSGRTGYILNTLVQPAPAAAPAPTTPTARPANPAPPPANVPAAAPPAARPPAADPAPPPAAQTTTRTRMSTSMPKIGVHAFVIIDGESMAAKKSFEAILGADGAAQGNIGFGVEATNLWKGVFARFAYSMTADKEKNTGSRVFLDSSNVPHSLNIPVKIELAATEIGGGWRFNSMPIGPVVLTPYAGFAFLIQKYKETSDFATAEENVDTSDSGQALFGGLEIGIKMFKIGVEGQYRTVPDALGVSGVSAAFNEKNLGGTVFRLTFGVGF